MYKKVSQSFNNRFGIERCNELLTSKPCILGIVPTMNNIRMYNGYFVLLMYMLQIRRVEEADTDYDIKDLPFDLLMMEKDDKIDISILNKIPTNNVMEAKKILRSLNIFSYCNGNNTTGKILNSIHQGLLDKGYSESDANEIMSQIFVLQVVDNYYNNKLPYATVVTVHDIYDFENTDYYFENEKKSLFQDNPFINLRMDKNNDRYVLYKSFGEGSLAERQDEHVFQNDYAKAPIINYIMALYLIKALHMSLSGVLIDNNISLQSEIENISRRVVAFCEEKNKDYTDFTKEDLDELNNFLMKDIGKIFIHNITIKTLSPTEKEYLDRRELAFKQFNKDNPTFNIDDKIDLIMMKVEFIIQLNDKYNDDEVAYIERSNNGKIEHKKDSAIRLHAKLLISAIENLMYSIDTVVIPNGIDNRLLIEYKEYIKERLDIVKNILLDDKLQEILEKYCTIEEREKLHI